MDLGNSIPGNDGAGFCEDRRDGGASALGFVANADNACGTRQDPTTEGCHDVTLGGDFTAMYGDGDWCGCSGENGG